MRYLTKIDSKIKEKKHNLSFWRKERRNWRTVSEVKKKDMVYLLTYKKAT